VDERGASAAKAEVTASSGAARLCGSIKRRLATSYKQSQSTVDGVWTNRLRGGLSSPVEAEARKSN